ncbi:hypothetical protein FOIG_11298 [Fusarium odoratissimum NRRL 54006]|uniref:Uncharacterized protein n=2 Tax=Fusarium oxysporum species complex TaxID=171631 RepID=X0J5C9_FUSO5|nr:uncharacterized protein FOIG_11298 [Fusarium odoratissimum NRRL 54006]EXL96337.1 hypothetical protein FOIG_11298 [Fusarium odoratissimum NRRL 54006]TXB99873.1 hypothetical protein FocTR4_00013701 [Fusarium oxysporum f. sp. cubense]
MDTIRLCSLLSVRDPRRGESRMAFHFTRKPDGSILEPTFDGVMRAYNLEVTHIMYTEFEDLLSLYVFAAGHDWNALKEETLKICEEKKIARDWRLMWMGTSTRADTME